MKLNELTTEYATAWRNSFEYKGRCTRRSFWTFTLANAIVMTGVMLISGIVTGNPCNAFYSLACAASFFPCMSIQVRRFHDTGRSGKGILIFLGIVVLLVACSAAATAKSALFSLVIIAGELGTSVRYICILAQKGQDGYNRYGEDPESKNKMS